jgi:hypothetical protein
MLGQVWSRRAAIALTLTAVVGLGWSAIALSSTSSTVIHACATKRTGALRILAAHKRCKRSERAVGWNQVGPQGPAGGPGARGPVGPTGAVDDTNFYSKSASDARYLGLHGTADDSSQLGGQPPAGYVTAGFDVPTEVRLITDTVTAGNSDELYPAIPLGRLTATCADPATSSTLQYVFEGSTGTIQRSTGSTTTYGTSDAGYTTARNDHVSYLVTYSSGTVVELSVWVANGPGVANDCVYNVLATIVGNS